MFEKNRSQKLIKLAKLKESFVSWSRIELTFSLVIKRISQLSVVLGKGDLISFLYSHLSLKDFKLDHSYRK